MLEFKKITAFLKKELRLQMSYRLDFVLGLLGIAGPVFIFFFIDRLFGHRITPYLEPYGSNYFAYILVSLALFNYVGAGLGSLAEKIREEELQGTLEAVLATPTRITTILTAFSLWNFITASLELFFYIILGLVLVKTGVQPNYLSIIVILFLSIVAFSSLGMLSASFIMVFKRGDPLSLAVYGFSSLLGGVYFPVTVLPLPLRAVSSFLPITYAIRSMELAIFRGCSIFQLSGDIIPLLFFSLFLLPVSLISFSLAIRKAKTEGSLSFY